KGALSLFLADVNPPTLAANTNCYAHASSGAGLATCVTGARFTAAGTVTTTTLTNVTGTGWIPVNFNAISSGSPLSVEPVDPINNATYFYAYRADTTNFTYEINADMESTKYSYGQSGDVE